MPHLRKHLSYANVVATLALFLAVGGSSYAALQISGRQVVNNSIRSQDLRNNDVRGKDVRNRSLSRLDIGRDALGGTVIKESALKRVPDATLLQGLPASDFKLRCPLGTIAKAGVCVEGSARSPLSFPAAFGTCSNDGRQLPDYTVLTGFVDENHPITQSEWTSNVYEGDPDQLKVVLVAPPPSGVAFAPALTPTQRPFRCVALPSNN
jgi:hypothetical protein